MSSIERYLSNSPDETEAIGVRLGRFLSRGDAVAFFGELGSGKTTMIRGIAASLGVDAAEVVSPTFTIVNRYEGRCPVFHIDLYRIEKPQEIDELGLWEMLNDDGVCLIEWTERAVEILPAEAIRVELSRVSEDVREIKINARNGE